MVYQADILGFFRTVLIIILVFYAFRLIMRVLAPFILRFFAKKVQKNFENQFKQQQTQHENYTSNQADIKVSAPPKNKSNPKKGFEGGEYIDYEEVE